MTEIGQGLTLSGIGILITFSALGILILLILLLKAVFPGKGKDPMPSLVDGMRHSGKDHNGEGLKKRAAAAAVAVLLAQKPPSAKGSLGKELEKPVGEWWQRGLGRIHSKE